MACQLKIKFDKRTLLLNKDVDSLIQNGESISFEQIANMIVNLDKKTRNALTHEILTSLSKNLTENDVKEGRWISNTSLETMQKKWPSLAELFPDIGADIDDNYILVLASKMRINGSEYFGRAIDANGKEVFVINGYAGAKKFFNYLNIKKKLSNILNGEALIEDYALKFPDMDVIAKAFKSTPKAILLDYLNNKSEYCHLIQIGEGQNKRIINAARVLNEILYLLTDDFEYNIRKSDLRMALDNINISDSKFDYKFNMKKLYDVIKNYKSDIDEYDKFKTYTKEELDEVLEEVFLDDPKFVKYELDTIFSGKETTKTSDKTKTINKEDLSLVWKTINNDNKDAKEYKKAVKENAQEVVDKLNEYFQNHPYTDNEGNIADSVSISLNEKGNITAKYTLADLTTTKVSNPTVLIKFPYTNLNKTYDFAYNTKRLFTPVTTSDGSVNEGLYNGRFIYKYVNPKTNKISYLVSNYYVNPETYPSIYDSIDAAKLKIDYLNKTENLLENGLHRMKQEQSRVMFIDGKFQEGGLVTVKDIELPKVKLSLLPSTFLSLIYNGTIDTVKQTFSYLKGIENLHTPEDGMSFLLLAYKAIGNGELNEELNKHRQDLELIIKQISEAKRVSYIIEQKLSLNTGIVKFLKDNGNDINVSGTYDDDTDANHILTSSMENAVNYFVEKIPGLKIHTLTFNDLVEFNNKNKLGINSEKLHNIRGFVHDGEIYINTTDGDLSDLFHEISHIFLGVIKAKYPSEYQTIISNYIKNVGLGTFKGELNRISSVYTNFAELDKIEEAVVTLIAKKMFRKKELLTMLDAKLLGSEILKDFEFITTNLKKRINIEQGKSANDLGFVDMMSLLISENITDVKKNMKLSLLVRLMIKDGKIIEYGC